MIEKIIICLYYATVFWLASSYLESWYWLQHDNYVSAKTYHVARVLMTVLVIYVMSKVIGLPATLFSTSIGIILYEFNMCRILHGSWKFWKSWTWKLPFIEIHYPTYAGWICILIINIGFLGAWIEGKVFDVYFWCFYIPVTAMFWIVSFLQKKNEIK